MTEEVIDFKKHNKYMHEMNKSLTKEVEVTLPDGQVLKGKLRGFTIQHFNLCLMTKDEKVIIRNWTKMKRKRNKDDHK